MVFMKENVNKELISAMESHVQGTSSMVNTVSEILDMGKESVYRRFRGEVLFTFDEVAKLTRRLNISVDDLVGLKNVRRAVFNLESLPSKLPLPTDYLALVRDYVQVIQNLGKHASGSMSVAYSTIPFHFMLPYKFLMRFSMLRWMNQQNGPVPLAFSEIELPPEFEVLQQQFAAAKELVPYAQFLLDGNVFSSFLREMHYFAKSKLLAPEDFSRIRKELLSVLDDLEILAGRGTTEAGNEVLIYISQVDFKASYSYFEYNGHALCSLRLYGVNRICSVNPEICRIQQNWIDSLKRYSTLISQSGEIQRSDYLHTQRSLIKNMKGRNGL